LNYAWKQFFICLQALPGLLLVYRQGQADMADPFFAVRVNTFFGVTDVRLVKKEKR
jgi:hypothetical protein